ncbi:MAG: sugar phosphate isomerase/epimerase family protein [Bacillota bacterium]
MLKLSIDGYSFHGLLDQGKMDIFHYFESVKYRYGILAVGIWNGFLPGTEEHYLKKVREALDEKGLVVANLAVDQASVWDDDEASREAFRRNALDHIRAAAYIGAASVRIDWGIHSHELNEEQWEFISSRYREYCSIAADNGMVLGPENHFGASLDPNLQLKMVEAVSHPAYKILLHLGRWKVNADTGDQMVAPHVMHTHVDQRTAEAEPEARIGALVNGGYDGYWGIEYGSGKDEYVMVEWQLARTKRALVKVCQGE